MQTTRFASIGSRVEIATLMLVSTVTSKKPSTRPGITCLTCSHCFALSAIPPAASRRSYSYLYHTPAANRAPRTT